MQYEDLCQWRSICEFLDSQWYKFLDDSSVLTQGFTLLLTFAKPHREELWSNYMIQLVQFGKHPHAHYHRRSEFRKKYGWRLLPDWEVKIDFLEKITLFNNNPDDLPQPWRQAIWEAFFRRKELDLEQERLVEEWWSLTQQEHFQKLKEGDCPAKFHCQSMTGMFVAGECPNFQECRNLMRSL
jgi:hypothetical protein